ncbi:hypothetical protein [Sedimentitalea sp.]|uniref:hypothetical protein n=1 Tax=Sedimentitalea sp. TaxID=2048915 RepID=UPI0032968E54
MADRTPLVDLTRAIVPNLVSSKTWGDASFVNLPLAYPSGAFVTIRMTHVPEGVRVSDAGFAYREIESFGASRSFSRIAQTVVEEHDLCLGKRAIYVDVPEHEVERAILDVSAASYTIATKIVARISSDSELTISDELHMRLDRLFPQTTYEAKIVGSSSTEWDVTAVSQFDRETAIFQIVTNYPVSVFRTSTAFHDIAALGHPPRLISVIKSKKEMGRNYSILAQAGRVIEIDQTDEAFEKAVA